MARFNTLRRLKPARIALSAGAAALAMLAAAQFAPAAAAEQSSGNPFSGTRGGAMFGSAPSPAAGANADAGQKNAFTSAPEGGFIRISFARLKADSAANAGDSVFYGLIELDLKPGWKTYWRNPGTSGFAPQIHLDGGAKAEILYPAPQIFNAGEDWTYGYKHHVALPVRLILPQQQSTAYSGSLTLGICEKLCLPQTLPFRFSPADGDGVEQSALRAALTALPQPADKKFGLLSAKAAKDGLALQLAYPRGAETPQLFLDGGDIQLGAAEPRPADLGGKTGKSGADSQLYFAPRLFGELKSGAPIYYTATANGRAVSGVIHIQP